MNYPAPTEADIRKGRTRHCPRCDSGWMTPTESYEHVTTNHPEAVKTQTRLKEV